MVIKKGDKEYIVTELKNSWKLVYKLAMVTVNYEIPKDICANEEELRAYVEREKVFLGSPDDGEESV